MSTLVTQPVSSSRPRIAIAHPAVLLLVLMSIGSFVFHFAYANRLKKVEAMHKPDILFNADADLTLRAFTLGWANLRLKHPNLSNFVTPPVRAVSWVAARLTNPEREREIREHVALAVIPLAGVLRLVILFSLGRLLAFTPWQALALCGLDTASASRMIFGTIPESFALSGLALIGILWLGVAALKGERRPHQAVWIVAGILSVGVTISNIVPFTLMLLAVSWTGAATARAALWTTTMRVSAVLAGTVAIWGVFYAAIQTIAAQEIRAESHSSQQGTSNPGVLTVAAQESQYLHGDALGKLVKFPTAFLETLAAPEPAVVPYSAPVDIEGGPDIMFILDGPVRRSKPYVILAIAVTALLAAGTWAWLARRDLRPFLFACLAIVLYKVLFHLVYGDELFLYSQDWQPILTLLTAGVLFIRTKAVEGIRSVALPAVIVAMFVNNLGVIRFIEQTLANHGAPR